MIRLFRYLRPYGWSIAAVLFLIFVQSITDLSLPTLMSDIVDKGIARGDTALIWRSGGWMLLLAFVGVACNVAAGYLSARNAMGFGASLRELIFGRVTSYSLREMDKLGTASLITRTTNDVTQVQMVTFMIQRMMIMAPMMAIGGIVMAVGKEPKMAWMLLVVIPVMAATIALMASRATPLFKAIQKKLDGLNRVMRENLTGIRVIRAFDRIEREKARFDQANADLTGTTLKVNRLMALLFPLVMFMMNLTIIAIIWFGGRSIDRGEVQIGSLMAFMQYTMQIMFSIIMVSMMFIMVPRAQASALRINEVLDTVAEMGDPALPRKPGASKGRIEFRDVTFSYHGAEQPALRKVSFSAGPGEVTAVIGGTGSGKSTLVNLIPRFYDVDSGQILVDGVDLRDMTQEELRSRIGFVPQKAVLFTGTIAENIRFGRPEASDEEVERAAAVAQAADFIAAQGGANVSGGQKQRLSIARAVARKPEIYVFDDSFSALDFKTDARLRAALGREIAESTVIIVAQRASTVMGADRILVLEEGRLVGAGKHKELMAGCEVYREIVSSQLSEEELA
jgi:ATP-binding cassette subfamily B multidrug efflux pump